MSPRAVRNNDLGVFVVMTSGLMTMTKRNLHHILESLGHETRYKVDLDRGAMFVMKI